VDHNYRITRAQSGHSGASASGRVRACIYLPLPARPTRTAAFSRVNRKRERARSRPELHRERTSAWEPTFDPPRVRSAGPWARVDGRFPNV